MHRHNEYDQPSPTEISPDMTTAPRPALVSIPLLDASGPGNLLAGGGIHHDHAVIWSALYWHLRAHFKESRPRVGVLTSGRATLDAAQQDFYQHPAHDRSYQSILEDYGMLPVHLALALDQPGCAEDADVIAAIDDCHAIFLGGGWQERHARVLLQDDGSDTPALAAIRRLRQRGGIVMSTSAGSMVQAAYTYSGGLGHHDLIRHPFEFVELAQVNLTAEDDYVGYTYGLNLLNHNIVVETHAESRQRYIRNIAACRELEAEFGLILPEGSALLIVGDVGRLYGSKPAVIVHSAGTQWGDSDDVNVTGLRVSLLSEYDEFNFVTQEVIPFRMHRVDDRAYSDATHQFLQQGNLFVRLIEHLADSAVDTSITSNREDNCLFVFHKGPDTRAWERGQGEYSIASLLLDITPYDMVEEARRQHIGGGLATTALPTRGPQPPRADRRGGNERRGQPDRRHQVAGSSGPERPQLGSTSQRANRSGSLAGGMA